MAKDPVFVTTHVSYDSYTDYWKLVKASGFEICHQDQINVNRDCVYVLSPSNGDVEAMLRIQPKPADRQCQFAVWFLERPGTVPKKEFAADIASRFSVYGLNHIWFSDRAMWGIVRDVVGTKFVPMGSDEAIGTTHKTEEKYDITHMSYVWGRRSFLNYPHLMKIKPERIGGNCWGDDRDRTMRTSKFMVNVHQDGGGYHEPLRFALCAAYGVPMISESCEDPYPYEPGRDFLSVPYDQLQTFIPKTLKDDYNRYKGIGLNMWDTATKKFRFKNNVEGALV